MAAGLALLLVVGAGYTAWLDIRITQAFEGKRWSVPARVYARPLELHAGLRITPENLETELQAADYSPVGHTARPGQYARDGREFLIRTRDFRFWDGTEPSRRLRVRIEDNRVAAIRNAGTGAELPLVRLDPAHIGNIYPAHREDRILVRLEEVPPTLVGGLLVVEDREFLSHHGLSFSGIARAMLANIRAGRVVQGGSTLTQQLVKNYFLTNERTLWRKGNEAVMALLLEWHYDKQAILQAYLNEVYLGQEGDRSIHGIGLASRFYFGADLADLSVADQALLIALIRGPSYYDPRRYPDRARERRNLVIDQMAEHGVITAAEARHARNEGLGVLPDPAGARTDHPAFMDLVRRHLRRDYRDSDLNSEGLRIFTTLAPHVQAAAEAAVQVRSRQWNDGTQTAVVSVAVDSGEVEAVVGGRNPRFPGFNRALGARRPVGSLIKPAVYLTALMRPERYGLGTPLSDEPVTLQDAGGKTWTPRNYDRERHGSPLLWRSLADSYNVPTVRLGLDLGLRAVADTVSRLGVAVPDTLYPSMLLGAFAATPLEMASMYETLATGGFRTPLRSVRAVMTAEGELLSRYSLSVDRAFDPEPVFLLNNALQRVVHDGTGKGLARWVSPEKRVAGKTGTTDGLRDSWFAGFTGSRLAVVWTGRDDNGRTALTGSSGAMTVWGDMFGRLSVEPLRLTPPPGVVPAWIDGDNGLRAERYCRDAVQLPYIEGSVPSEASPCVREGSVVQRAGNWIRGWFD